MADLIPIDLIYPNQEQPRKHFERYALKKLAASIREQGVLQPISVIRVGDSYILVDGERRLRAARMAGLTEIPADVRDGEMPEARDMLLMALVANVQREDLNPIEEGQAYQRMHQEFKMSQMEIARRTGVSIARVSGRLKLLELDQPIQNLIAVKRLHRDVTLANELIKIPDEEARIKLAEGLAQSKANLDASIDAARKVSRALLTQFESGTPALSYGKRKAGVEKLSLPEWDALYQLNRVPPWQVVTEAAMGTCDNCGLRPVASEENCGQCPAVELLRRMLERAQRGTNGH